jgi:hypothetical protein
MPNGSENSGHKPAVGAELTFRNIFFILVVFAASTAATLSCKFLIPEEQPVEAGAILYQDDFSDPSSGWNRISTDTGETEYDDGVYRILVNESNTDIWSKSGRSFEDAVIEVDAFKVGGVRDNRFGVICRATSDDTFYTFIISSDGYYGIGKVKGAFYELIGTDALLPSEEIEKGSAINRIRAECIGDRLSLFVNGVKIDEVRDSELVSGEVGLIAGTYNEPGTDIRFDNFIVRQP